MMAEPWWV